MTDLRPGSGSQGPVGAGGKLVITVFFLFFFGMGALFVWLIAREAVAGLQTWTWPRTDCQVIRSAIRETDQRGRQTGDYYLDVEYQYSFNGQTYSSNLRRLRQSSFQDYGKAERLAEQYRPGSSSVCYVNPKSPGQAVLVRGSLLFPLVVLFPLIFVAIGAIGIYTAWRPRSVTPAVSRPISDRAKGGLGQRFATAFFGLFMVIGLVVFYAVSIRPASGILNARQWPTVSCRVLSSEVRTHSGNRGNPYSVNILYAYVVNDREYKANRYDFMGGSSSGFAAKQSIVNRYPPGSQAVCYVNPGDPTEAVLERGFTPIMWIGLLPLIFVVLGLIGLVSSVRKRRAQGPNAPLYTAGFSGVNPTNAVPAVDETLASAPLVLKPRSSPTGKLVAATVGALFWNGIISVFVVNLFKSWRTSPFEWFLALFLVPFVLIGLGLVVAVGYFFLALFNPRPRLTLVPGAPRLGDSVRLEWEISGRVESLQKFQLRLEGREEATYTRGTRSSTDRSVFANLEVAATSATQEMRSGVANVVIPQNLMHSFACPHNKIIWSVQVKGEIPRWPDLNEEFALTVLPALRNNHGHS